MAGLCCCPKHSWSTLLGSWSSSAPKPLSEKLARGDLSSCSGAVGFGAQFQSVPTEDGWQDGAHSHAPMGGTASCSPSITAAPSPSACCLSPFARFFIIFDRIKGGKKKRQSGCAIVGLLAGAALPRPPGSAPGLPPGGFSPSLGVWSLELLLSGLNAAKSAWCMQLPPGVGGCARCLCQNCALCMRGDFWAPGLSAEP